MNVVMCCTRNWYQYLYTVIFSLRKTNDIKKLILVIEDDSISGIDADFININKVPDYIKESSPNYKTKYTKMCMTRLFLTKILKCEKVLYLDVDAIVISDISKLWNIKLETNEVIAGVKEPGEWDKHLNTTGLDNNYINSGVLLMDLKKIRELRLDDSMLELINRSKFDFPDQDVINLVCRNRIHYISNEYNSTETTGMPKDINDVKIMHYIRERKGWIKTSPYSHIWTMWNKEMLKEMIGMFKVKAIINFTDNTEDGKLRVVGDEWEISKERYEQLTGNNDKNLIAVELVEFIPKTTPKEDKRTKSKSIKKK